MLSPDLVDNFSDMASVVRKGGTLLDGRGTVEPENPIWIDRPPLVSEFEVGVRPGPLSVSRVPDVADQLTSLDEGTDPSPGLRKGHSLFQNVQSFVGASLFFKGQALEDRDFDSLASEPACIAHLPDFA